LGFGKQNFGKWFSIKDFFWGLFEKPRNNSIKITVDSSVGRQTSAVSHRSVSECLPTGGFIGLIGITNLKEAKVNKRFPNLGRDIIG
jgi:hypothetical protein